MLVSAKAFAVSINQHLIAIAERPLVLVVAVLVRGVCTPERTSSGLV